MALDVWAHAVFRFLSGYLGTGGLSGLAIILDILVMLYMIGSGLDQASCAFVGQALGAGRVDLARQFYRDFCYISATVIFFVIIIFNYFKEDIVCLYTNIESVRSQVLLTIPLMLFNIFPDLFKGMLKGIIKALGIQAKAVKVHIICHWFIFMTLIYVFAFRWKWGLPGMFMAKICLEYCIISSYLLIIKFSDWDQISVDA